MKRFLLFFTVLVVGSSILNGQSFRFGLNASPRVNYFKPDNITSTPDSFSVVSEGAKLGISAGFIFDFYFDENNRYGLSTGLSIANLGGKLLQTKHRVGGDSSISYNAALQFIELPITLRLRTNEIGLLTYFGQVGIVPAFAIRRRATLVETHNTVTLPEVPNQDSKDYFNFFNMGLYLAAGVEYGLTENTSFISSLSFNSGIVNLVDDNDGQRVILNQIGLNIGVLF